MNGMDTLEVIEESIKGTYVNPGVLLSPIGDLSQTSILYYYSRSVVTYIKNISNKVSLPQETQP
jgi:hypothetical protein